MWKWSRWRYQFRRQELTAFIWFVPLLWLGWFVWTSGYQVLAVIVVIAGTLAGGWLQWALWSARLSPNAARTTMAVNDPAYDIPLEDHAVPSNPASDPLYDIGEDFQASPTSPDPLIDPGEGGEGGDRPAEA